MAGLPALIVGAIAGRRIYKTGWVGWRDMFILIGLTSVFIIPANIAAFGGLGGSEPIKELVNRVAGLGLLTFVTAVILRVLIVGFGVIRHPAEGNPR
ncbi:MAG: hypothetical protein KTR19_06750 [Hyphomicrobiales bacterium]|nr:hypothetical protein [Hyphomicrobiales bacterium]